MTDTELLEQFQLMSNGMVQMEERLKRYVDERARHTEILIENVVTKRIDSLFDGYKLRGCSKSIREKQIGKFHCLFALSSSPGASLPSSSAPKIQQNLLDCSLTPRS